MLPIYPGKTISNFNLPFLLFLQQMLSKLSQPKVNRMGEGSPPDRDSESLLGSSPAPGSVPPTLCSPQPSVSTTARARRWSSSGQSRQPGLHCPIPFNTLTHLSRPLSNKCNPNEHSLLEILSPLVPVAPHTSLFGFWSSPTATPPPTPRALPSDLLPPLRFLSCRHHSLAHDLLTLRSAHPRCPNTPHLRASQATQHLS